MLDDVRQMLWSFVPTWREVGVATLTVALAFAYMYLAGKRVHRVLFPRAGVPGSVWLIDPVAKLPASWLFSSSFLFLMVDLNTVSITLSLIILVMMAGVAFRRTRFFCNGVFECCRCGYERPSERTEAFERCPECGNEWWRDDNVFADEYPHDVQGVRPVETRTSRRVYSGIVGGGGAVAVLAFGLVIARMNGSLQDHMPRALLLFDLKHARGIVASHALVELMSRDSADREKLDQHLRVVTERREQGEEPLLSAMGPIDRAITQGRFGDEALSEFFRRTNRWSIRGELTPDGAALEPVIHLDAFDRTIIHEPMVVSAGIRLGDGPFLHPIPNPMDPTDLAHTFNDFRFADLDGTPHTEVAARARSAWSPPFTPVSVAALPPGEHELTVRLHVFVSPGVKTTDVLIDPNGVFVPHAAQLWHEVVDLTATFTIPADSR